MEFNSFVLSDAAPMGHPLIVDELLRRAEHLVDRRRGAIDANQVELLVGLGRQFDTEELHEDSRRILEKAYKMSRSLVESSARAKAACALASRASELDLPRATALIHEGLALLPNKPQYALDRVFCLSRAREVRDDSGHFLSALELAQEALRELRASPFDSDLMELHVTMDVAEAMREAGNFQGAIEGFAQVSTLITKLGRENTQTAGTLYNNWGVALESAGQIVPAEEILRRAIAVNKAAGSDHAESPMLLTNYARTLRSLAKYDEAAATAEQAVQMAKRHGVDQAADQAVTLLADIYIDQHAYARSLAIQQEVEPRLRRHLPPDHYVFWVMLATRALALVGLGDEEAAISNANRAIVLGENAVNRRQADASMLAGVYLKCAKVRLGTRRAAAAVNDAQRSAALMQSVLAPGTASSGLGDAYLTLARAFQMTGDLEAARRSAQRAVDHFSKSVGPDNTRTRDAREIAEMPMGDRPFASQRDLRH